MEVCNIGANTKKTDDLGFDCTLKCVFWMIAGFMEKGVYVCRFKVDLGLYGFVCLGGGAKKDCSVKEVDLILIQYVFNFNGGVVSIEGMDKLCELCSAMGPNTKNVVQVPEVDGGF